MTTQTAMQLDSATQSPQLARQAKEQGMARACSPQYRKAMLDYARSIAFGHAILHGTVTAEDVRVKFIARQGLDDWLMLGNAVGSLFRGGQWRPTGEFVKSGIVSRRAGMLRVWRLADAITGHQGAGGK